MGRLTVISFVSLLLALAAVVGLDAYATHLSQERFAAFVDRQGTGRTDVMTSDRTRGSGHVGACFARTRPWG
jgi:hypothetical protein